MTVYELPLSMAHLGSPDTPGRSLPSWATHEATDNIDDALKALETYKKKDPSKGTPPHPRRRRRRG